MLESADHEAPEGHRSLVVPEPVLRMTLRGEDVEIRALDSRGEALLEPLRSRLPAQAASISDTVLAAKFAAAPGNPGLPDRERLVQPSPMDLVRALVTLVGDADAGAPFPIAVYGGFSYELVDRFEDLPPRVVGPGEEPDLNVVLGLDGLVYDHPGGTITLVARAIEGTPGDAEERLDRWQRALDADASRSLPVLPPDPELPPFAPEVTDEGFQDGVRSFLEHIAAGDIFQGVLSRSLSVTSDAPPLEVYQKLRARNPSPYMFHFDLGDGVLLGASPETSVKVVDGTVSLSPIAGTVPRGFTADGGADHDLDARLAVSLLLDAKEQAEHAMLIDLARNDVARIAVPGTREVVAPLSIERFSHVQHLVTRVRGRLLPELDALDAYRACANMGTLTGSPKLRAMELIREHERSPRGFYGGALGYLTREGDLDTCIVIRSLRLRDGIYTVRAGAGVVAQSLPERELAETLHKSRAPLLALAMTMGETS